jgi:predicted amino acid racemase
MERQFPRLEINLPLLRENMEKIVENCAKFNINVCGVIKGCSGLPEIGKLFRECGCAEIGSSRIEEIVNCRKAGIPGPYLMLRVPMISELDDVVRWCDTSLQSDVAVLDALEAACCRIGKTHRVIMMADLGDLREGFWNRDELVQACVYVEKNLPHVHLAGVGVNLGCYGSIQPTSDKMRSLLTIAHHVEALIGRQLEVISGGASSSYTLVHWGSMPEGINHLRIGETALNARDLQVEWGISNMGLHMNGFVLKGEVLEVRTKPSYPVGQIVIDAFGRRPTYVDRGIRKRCLVGFGRADVGDMERLRPLDKGIIVLGGSSDHCILDIEDCQRPLKAGDIVEFALAYNNMLYATNRKDIPIKYLHE